MLKNPLLQSKCISRYHLFVKMIFNFVIHIKHVTLNFKPIVSVDRDKKHHDLSILNVFFYVCFCLFSFIFRVLFLFLIYLLYCCVYLFFFVWFVLTSFMIFYLNYRSFQNHIVLQYTTWICLKRFLLQFYSSYVALMQSAVSRSDSTICFI